MALCAGNSPVTSWFPSSMQVTHSCDLFFLMCTWINGLVNCSEAGGLISHRAHYDVTNVCTRIWHTPFIYLNLSPVPLILKLNLCNIGNGYFIIQHRFSWIVTTHPCPKVDKFDEYSYSNALYRYNFHLCLISKLVKLISVSEMKPIYCLCHTFLLRHKYSPMTKRSFCASLSLW